MRYFEKVSREEFKKYFDDSLYNEYKLPERSTENSAGYDFKAVTSFSIKPSESVVIPTGIKSCMGKNEFLMLVVRSSMGFKYNIRLCNQVGIIDSDYYNNLKNEGHIFVKLQNEGNDTYNINKGDSFIQGIFTNFLLIDNDSAINKRAGGIGSTNKES